MKREDRLRELTDRDREILRDVIRTFVLTCEPVSSRVLAKHARHGLSSATIRNILADLEDWGLLSQPHSSAGRIPTDAGYHMFIDSSGPHQDLSPSQRRQIDESLSVESGDGEQLMNAASRLLSEMSEQVGVVLTPTLGDTILKSLHFVELSGPKVLCVLVSASGFVDHKVIEISEKVPPEELVRISNYVTKNFADLTLREIRNRLLNLMIEERAQVDRLMADSIALAGQALAEGEAAELFVNGTTALLAKPELEDVRRVRQLLDTFERKAQLVQLLNQVVEGHGVRVIIGEDSELTSDLEFSLVGRGYGVRGRRMGTLGIFGPSRMDYQQIIPLVDYLGERLSFALEESIGAGDEN